MKLLALLEKEWRCLLRDWHGLLVLFVMPAVFILVMSLALKDTFKPSLHATGLPIVYGQPSEALDWLLEEMQLQGATVFSDRSPVIEDLHQADVVWAIVLPEEFDDDLHNVNQPIALEILAKPSVSMAIVQALQARLERALAVVRINKVLNPQLKQFGSSYSVDKSIQVNARHLVEQQQALNAVQQSVPAWLTFGMFFVVIPLSNVIIGERQQGTLMRLAAMRISPLLILAGKWLPFYLVNLIQAGLMLLVGRYVVPLFGGDTLIIGEHWLALWLMISAVSAAALGLAFLIATVAKTTEQATMFGGVGNILLGAIGGIMVPTLVMPQFMRELAAYSPMNWGMEGLIEVLSGQADIGQLWLPTTLLFTLGLLLLLLASWRLQALMRE